MMYEGSIHHVIRDFKAKLTAHYSYGWENQVTKLQENGNTMTDRRRCLAVMMMAPMSEGRMNSPLGNHGTKVLPKDKR